MRLSLIHIYIDTHTKKVMENIKLLVEAGGGTMDSILQLTVFLTKIEDFEGMNTVFKTYFPHGGPARTTVAVAALPGPVSYTHLDVYKRQGLNSGGGAIR